MAFVPGHKLLADLLKAFGLEGRKVDGLVLEVRVNDAARLYVSEILDTDTAHLDDLVGCLHRLTVERAEVDARGCVTPVLHKSKMLTPNEKEALRAACQGTAEPHWRTPDWLEDTRRVNEVMAKSSAHQPPAEELEAIRRFNRDRVKFVEHIVGPDGVDAVDVTQWRVERGSSFPAVPTDTVTISSAGIDALPVCHIDWLGRVVTEQAILDATPSADPDEPTVIG